MAKHRQSIEDGRVDLDNGAPFSVRILAIGTDDLQSNPATRKNLLTLLPATYRSEKGELGTCAKSPLAALENELDLRRLNSVHEWLWLAGLPMPPRPLHDQLVVGRAIVIAERMDMHLVWTTGRLFVKPMPLFLLEAQFWAEYLSCGNECGCGLGDGAQECKQRQLRRCALGFMFSYAALLSFESDFQIAKEARLVPNEADWSTWRQLVEQLDLESMYARIDKRFYHGELRLSRLNFIFAISQTPFQRYLTRWNQYGAFVSDNFAWLAGLTAYIVIVLTAMQVGLATERLAKNNSFQLVSYGFTVFSILGPFAAGALILISSCCVFAVNVVRAVNFRNRRLRLRNLM